LINQLRKKDTPPEEIQQTIDKIHEQAAEAGIEDVLVASTDVFVTAICKMGAKSLSHVLSCIERGKDRFLKIAEESELARRQIVESVVTFWKDQPGVAVRIIDMLVNYTILAPHTVIQWVFGSCLGAGEALAESWVFEMVSNVMSKVSNRNRQIASARVQKGLGPEHIADVDEHLVKGRENARELFKYIEDATRGVAEGSTDRLLEKESNGEISAEEGLFIRAWGKRWHMVFLRKAAVEESIVGEAAIEAKLRLLAAEEEADGAAEPEPAPEAGTDEDMT
jgi:nuclear cap-binding protein subunit 1